MPVNCNNEIGVWAYGLNTKCNKSKELYARSDYGDKHTQACKSKYSFNLKNAPSDEKCDDWIAGKILKVSMLGKYTIYMEVEKAGGATPGWTKFDSYTKHDNCSDTFTWIASYDSCEDAVADKNCIAAYEFCDACDPDTGEPCPPTPPPVLKPPPPPPPVPMTNCLYKWRVIWNCNRQVGDWSYQGLACNHQGRWFEWLLTEQSSPANNYRCTLDYYTYGVPFPVTPARPNCSFCPNLWWVDPGATGIMRNHQANPAAIRPLIIGIPMGEPWSWGDHRIPTTHGAWWPRFWPTRNWIRDQKASVPCKCRKYYRFNFCRDCNGGYEKAVQRFSQAERDRYRLGWSEIDLLGGKTFVYVVWKGYCGVLTNATQADVEEVNDGKPASHYHQGNLAGWEPCLPATAADGVNCENCMHGVTIAKARCDIVDKHPELAAKRTNPRHPINVGLLTITEAEMLITEGLLEYSTLSLKGITGHPGCVAAQWVQDNLPLLYLDTESPDTNKCWWVNSVPCPNEWARNQSLEHHVTPRGVRYTVLKPFSAYEKLRDGTFTKWITPDDDCRTCLFPSSCPVLMDIDCKMPALTDFPIDWPYCKNPQVAGCKCETGATAKEPFNTRVKSPVAIVDNWIIEAEAHGGQANDRVHFWWLYRAKGGAMGDWKDLASSSLMKNRPGTMARCLSSSQFDLGLNSGRSVKSGAYPAGTGLGPLIKDKWYSFLRMQWVAERDNYEFLPLAFTCPCEKWRGFPAGNPRFPHPNMCECPEKQFPCHPITIARNPLGSLRCLAGNVENWCGATEALGKAGDAIGVCEVLTTSDDRPRHTTNPNKKIITMWFDTVGDSITPQHGYMGNCPKKTFQTWAFDWGAGNDSDWKDKWYCGKFFTTDQNNTNWAWKPGGAVSVNLVNDPYKVKWNQNIPYGPNTGFRIVGPSSTCCYKMTSIFRYGSESTYGRRIYDSRFWFTPKFHWGNHNTNRVSVFKRGGSHNLPPNRIGHIRPLYDLDGCGGRKGGIGSGPDGEGLYNCG